LAGLVITGKENSHSPYVYTATLFDSVHQKGLYANTIIGYFDGYDSVTDKYSISGGDYCKPNSYVSTYRSGTVAFYCAKETTFAVVEGPLCFYTLHYYQPMFCANGSYAYGPLEPTLYPTRQPSSSPTLSIPHIPAFATLNETYVKAVLLSVAGGSWATTNNWTEGVRLENWRSIIVTVDDNGVLSSPLEIYHDFAYKLSTAFPTELFLLRSAISVLSLASCGLTSTIPSYLADFVYLQRLVLYDNSMTGTIPTQLGSSTAIQEIYLNDNELTGTIPHGMFLYASTVNLEDNRLTGSVPEAYGDNLESLFLNVNYLTGKFPTTLAQASLQVVDLSHNQLSGKIPESTCEKSFFSLMLGLNNLGCYPSCLRAGISDVTVHYSRCPSGVDVALCDLESSFGVSTYLESITTPGTPFVYETAHPLLYIWEQKMVYYPNTDAVKVSVSFGCLSQLAVCLVRIYDGDGNSLFDATTLDTTTIPGCGAEPPLVWEHTTSIVIIYSNWEPMETYGFSVTITPHHSVTGWNCSNSYHASSYDDYTTEDLVAGSFAYAGNFCNWYGVTCEAGVSLSSLSLSAVGLVGTLPETIGLLGTIAVLNLGYNSISGTIPASIGQLTTLTELHLPSNDLRGAVPSTMANLSSTLQVMDLSSNLLTGTVPVWLDSFQALELVDLSTNRFHGKVSAGLCPLVNSSVLQKVELQYNGDLTCYESLCYEDTSVFRFPSSVHYCAPTSTPTGAPTMSSAPTVTVSSTSSISSGAVAGIAVAAVVALCGICYVTYRRVRTFSAVKYIGLPIHLAIITKQAVTEEMLLQHRSTISLFDADGNTVIDLILATSGCSITALVLSKLLMMRMIEMDAKHQEEEIIKASASKALPGDPMTAIAGVVAKAANSVLSKNAKVYAAEATPVEPSNNADAVMDIDADPFVPVGFGADTKFKNSQTDQVFAATGREEKSTARMIGSVAKGATPRSHASPRVPFSRYPDWVAIVQEESELCQEAVYLVLQALPDKVPLLSDCADLRGRRCIDIASGPVKEIMRRCSYLCFRYELKFGPPEHISATSAVIFASDHGAWSFARNVKDEDPLSAPVVASPNAKQNVKVMEKSGTLEANTETSVAKEVCLKFMRNKEQYLTEVQVRERAKLDPESVIAVLTHFSGDTNADCSDAEIAFRRGAIAKGLVRYPYCIVMSRAELSLKRIIDHNHIVGEDWDSIKTMFKQVVNCVQHMHSQKWIHGDLKPMNIMQGAGKMILIDLDASASFHEHDAQYAGSKYSSAYLPPELIVIGGDGNARVRVPPVYQSNIPTVAVPLVDAKSGKTVSEVNSEARTDSAVVPRLDIGHEPLSDYSLVRADPSLDMWALGALLYLLCSGMNLFRATVEDNIGSDQDLRALMEWSISTKETCLSVVKDKMARNLISLLLNKDPSKRLRCSHVLTHPFLTGKLPDRLQGETPVFDVFLSYRVSADSDHVKLLHDMLEATGLKVWWDKKCLLPGQPWEEGFCTGLANSGHFVCLLSRGAINSDKPWENFSKLENGSRCDNVLLEWRLALELKRRGMIEGMFPVMIGDVMEDVETHSKNYSHYFGGGCHPASLPACTVTSVEYKLLEHLDREGLGNPFEESMTVAAVVGEVLANQGGFIVGNPDGAWETVVAEINRMIKVTASRHQEDVHPQFTDAGEINLKYNQLLEENKRLKQQLNGRK
jgi:serine/threonine protein kinase/Leucine-rich repeat (LRR) protein